MTREKSINHYRIVEINNLFRLVDWDSNIPENRHIVLWESLQKTECEKAIDYLLTIQKSLEAYRGITGNRIQDGPLGTVLAYRQGQVSVSLAGEVIARADFVFVNSWHTCVVAGLPNGALSVNEISILDQYQRKGIGKAIHDFVTEVTGLPTIPNSVNTAPGSLSEKAEGFWAKRSKTRFVHGVTDREETYRRAISYYTATSANRLSGYRLQSSNPNRSFQFALEVNQQLGWPIGQVTGKRLGEINWISVSPDGKQFLTASGLQVASDHYREADHSYIFLGTLTDNQLSEINKKWMTDNQEAYYITPIESDALNRDVRDVAVSCGLLPPWSAPSFDELKSMLEERFNRSYPRLSALLAGKPDPYREISWEEYVKQVSSV
jgi:hypothetical protein